MKKPDMGTTILIIIGIIGIILYAYSILSTQNESETSIEPTPINLEYTGSGLKYFYHDIFNSSYIVKKDFISEVEIFNSQSNKNYTIGSAIELIVKFSSMYSGED
ncbi:MAG: hypothetical protein KAQ84_04490, partial [Thermoplasmatales archaeon]|nr:hypothetical protein [Thermoplasmatales archaeon]